MLFHDNLDQQKYGEKRHVETDHTKWLFVSNAWFYMDFPYEVMVLLRSAACWMLSAPVERGLSENHLTCEPLPGKCQLHQQNYSNTIDDG